MLLLVPEYSLTEPGETVTYKVILRANGKEIELENGLAFSSSNDGVSSVNNDGVATGVTAGTVSISVAWQDLTAHAQLDVVGSCAETNQHFAIIVDNSKSMSQAFSGSFATKLSFSKQTASDFCSSINLSKDNVSVWKVGDSATRLVDFQASAPPAQTAIASITSTNEKTNLTDALTDVIAAFPSDGIRVIVLFTDFEWTGIDPHSISQSFKDSGGFLVVVATQCWGDFFQDAAECASGGFLLSANEDTEDSISESLAGLKAFFCSGSCNPTPGTAPMAALNYTGFVNWDVTAGRVDLVGLGLWDVRPGNGLSVDMQGTGDAGYPLPGQDFGLGQLTSKVDYTFTNGKQYQFSIDVSGSLPLGAPEKPGTWTIRVRVGDGVDELITITDGGADFETHQFAWTQSGTISGSIIIEQTAQSGHHNVGTLIDNVLLENVTDVTTMLDDNFDTENQVTIPVAYSPYGCLDTPPGAQSASEHPPTPRVSE